ncbi:MAG TPA: NfeD family protein [Marmoricola sp.]|nr:NfeD family protein [Marmoricola sp.]
MEWIRDHLWQAWLILAALFGIVEMFSFDFVLLMFALGALVGMVAALLGLPGVVQILLALGSSLALLLVLRPSLIKRLHGGEELLIGAEALIGRPAIVLTELGDHTPGRVKIGGDEWSALPSEAGIVIPAGAGVEVIEIRGATAVVRPLSIEPPR